MIDFQCLIYRFNCNYCQKQPILTHFCHILGQKPQKPPKTPNRQKPFRNRFGFDLPKIPKPTKNFPIPFSQFTAILYIPHPIKKYKNKYPLAKILKKWTTWTTRLIIREICPTFALHLPYICPKWTTLTRQKLHDTKRNHQTIPS